MSACTNRGGLHRFYPIVPDIDWLARLVPLGIKTVQLRLKNTGAGEVRRQVSAAIEVCQEHRCQLVVNDHWKEAIDLGADYVHLGQEDLAAADLAAIKTAGIRLGVSTHDEVELQLALAAEPNYVALGPVYATKLKVMKWSPQGLDRLTAWKRAVGAIPLVAIGGMTPQRAPGAVEAGADSIAVVTDFITHEDPERRVRTWLDWAHPAVL